MKRAIQDSNFVTIQGWMVNHLHLTSDEAIVFALICGYKDGFREPISYIAAWIGKSEDTVRRILRRLVSAKLLSEEVIPSKPTAYRVVADCKGSHFATPANCNPRKMQGVGVANCDPTHIIDINNNISVVDAGARTRESEKWKQLLTKWVMDNEEGLTQMLLRAGLITEPKTTAELQAIIEPYINEYYLQIQMNGEEDIERRGRSDVKTHFARWIKKRVQAEKQELNKQSNGNNNHQTSTQRIANLEDIAQSILAGCQAGRASRQ